MRVLITGASGFVGSSLAAHAIEQGADVVGLARQQAEFVRADLLDVVATREAVRAAQPERVFHLAAQSSVREGWADPRAIVDYNVATTTHLLDAVVAAAPAARVLVAGSAEQYGPVPAERLPVTEDEPMRPQNPYAVSKCAADLVAGFYADAHGLDVVRTRSFNHAGPGARDRSVVSDFSRQIVAAERAGRERAVVHHADTRASRDFTDVRDVARAYWLALERAPAGAYNVCSGRAVTVAALLDGLEQLAAVPVERFQDPALMRKHEVMEMRGSHASLTAATGWEPLVPLEETLADTFHFWRAAPVLT
jgi:GDP-4-dehydro-6-deoxy-D-mannose reductase